VAQTIESQEWVRGFDHWDAAVVRDPYPSYARLRSECPVARSEEYGGFWIVSRYRDIVEICQRPEIFSSRYLSIPKDIGAGDMPLPPINIDPPRHTRIRRLLLPFFSPGRVTALEPATRAIVSELLDAIAGNDEFDASARITKPLPVKVTERLLGTPAEDAPRF